MNANDNDKKTVEKPPSFRKTSPLPKKDKHDRDMEKSAAAHKRRKEMIILILLALLAASFVLLLFFDEAFRQEHAITIMTALLAALAGFGAGKIKE